MRALYRRAAAVASAVALAAAIVVAAEVRATPVPAEEVRPDPATTTRPENFEASCRTVVEGSRAVANCHNPYPGTDRVQLHVECDRWWDVDTDSAPVDIGPTAYAQLTGRCWKEVRSVWLTHQPVEQPPPANPARGS